VWRRRSVAASVSSRLCAIDARRPTSRASDAHVILSDELIVGYWWFLDQRQKATVHDEIGWHPNSEYTYYWATIHEGKLVEFWWIPVG
jgi:hypothetical protein